MFFSEVMQELSKLTLYDKDATGYIAVISYFYIGNIILMWHKFKVIIELMAQECREEMQVFFRKTNYEKAYLGKVEYNK